MASHVPLGFAIDIGRRVWIPVCHLAVTGVTQQAGKTTALEGLIARSHCRAVAFRTKRGESAFNEGPFIPPYFRERADWQFVASVIDAALHERNKSLRPWLIELCRDTRSLLHVLANVQHAQITGRSASTRRALRSIEAYLELVIPQVVHLPTSGPPVIKPGLNVMDITPFSAEVQALIVQSTLTHIHDREEGVISVIPEAWQFLPEHRGSPVKHAAEQLIRKGASVGNFVWIDSQDLAAVSKLAIRACSVLLVGVQREHNEIKRTLANLPLVTGGRRPGVADIQSLKVGEFWCSYGGQCTKVYAQPVWMTDSTAQRVACGGKLIEPPEDEVTRDEADALRSENTRLLDMTRHQQELILTLERTLAALQSPVVTPPPVAAAAVAPAIPDATPTPPPDAAPAPVMVEATTVKGRLGQLIAAGYFDEAHVLADVVREVARRWPEESPEYFDVHRGIASLIRSGFLVRDGLAYQRAAGATVRVQPSPAA